MKTKISKWGNSLALRLPKKLLATYELSEGSDMIIEETKEGFLLKPVEKKKYSLEELMEGVTPESYHKEITTGDPQGKEIW